MNLNQVTWPSTDVSRAVEFYRRMGFRQIVAHLPDYARFECPNGIATFSLHRVDALPQQGGHVVYFECEDLDATVRRLGEQGIPIEAEPRDQPWLWREAYVRDPDGNSLCLFHAGANRRFPPWRLRDPEGSAPDSIAVSVEEDLDPADGQLLGQKLTEHALPVVGRPGFLPLAALARDGGGRLVGGIAATVNWEWLSVNLVWVEESLRGTGLGHRLLEEIERAGRRRGCTRAHLDTFSYQARPFYERHGYEVFATLDDYPGGHQRFYMRKSLDPASDGR